MEVLIVSSVRVTFGPHQCTFTNSSMYRNDKLAAQPSRACPVAAANDFIRVTHT